MLSINEMKKLPTPRLLSYFKKIRNKTLRLGSCDCGCGEPIGDVRNEGHWQIKEYKKFSKHRDQVKKLLDTREHVEK